MSTATLMAAPRVVARGVADRHRWHIVTGEYPPQPGGVSDYTHMVARALAEAGDEVVVWAPDAPPGPVDRGVEVRRLPDCFGVRSLVCMSRALAREPRGYRVLVQYVPHAFGWKAANLLFCLWLRLRPRDSVWVMFHEVAYPFDREDSLRHNLLALANRVMAWLVGRGAARAFVSIPAWRPSVESFTDREVDVKWLPVPSAIPIAGDAAAQASVRARLAPGRPLVGHFGTYGSRIVDALDGCLPALVARVDCSIVLLGRGSDVAARRLTEKHPSLCGRVYGTGALAPRDVSHHIAACDVMLQPYPDGVSSRRTSAMAAIAHGRPLVTTIGPLTEPLWSDSSAATLVPADEPVSLADATASLLTSEMRRTQLAANAALLYERRFALRHTVQTLRDGRACAS